MDLFQIPDDYKPQKPLTNQQMDDITNYLKNHPLFLKQIPQNISDNQHLVALQSLMEDQDPLQLAQNLNAQGSKKLKQKPQSLYHMRDAYKKYTQGINVKCQSNSINAKLHSNRAAINFKLKNYGKVIEDCRKCLNFDPNYVKAYYRFGKALNALNRYKQTIQLLSKREQQQIKQLLSETIQLQKKQDQKLEQLKNQKNNKLNAISQYCNSKKYRLQKRNQSLPQNINLQFIDGKLSIPLLIIYPQFNQFDIIAKTFENQKIKVHLGQLLSNPLPWDQKNQYKFDTVEIYGEVTEETMLKIPKQCTIGQILSKVPIKQCLEIYLVKPGNQFYQKYLSQYKFI